MTITFNTEHDKFYQLLFFTENMMFINLLVNTPVLNFMTNLNDITLTSYKHKHTHI